MSGIHYLPLESPLILLIAYLKPLDTAKFVEAPARQAAHLHPNIDRWNHRFITRLFYVETTL